MLEIDIRLWSLHGRARLFPCHCDVPAPTSTRPEFIKHTFSTHFHVFKFLDELNMRLHLFTDFDLYQSMNFVMHLYASSMFIELFELLNARAASDEIQIRSRHPNDAMETTRP